VIQNNLPAIKGKYFVPSIKKRVMNILRLTLITLVVLCSQTFIHAQDYETNTYFENDSLTLKMDLFLPEEPSSSEVPLVIYVHGGGFSSGDRTAGHNLGRKLIKNDIACASITYTLYMKDKSFSCNGILSEKIKAIQIAASQLWHATDYLIKNSEQFQIDTSEIFIAGSSAGAETVLHAAYWNRSEMQLYSQALNPEFQYAGVIAGAGAIMDLNLITKENNIPMMFFHGDEDPLVPYATASHHYCPPNSSGWLMFFGSYSIAQHLDKLDGIYQLTTFKGGDHSFAGAYFYQNQQPVVDFINRILDGEQFMEHRLLDVKDAK
jgi:predicted esterase